MLVLSRRAQQSIRIGDSVTITILKIKGNTVRIGIEAPTETRIIRAELSDFGPSETLATPEASETKLPTAESNRVERYVEGSRQPKPELTLRLHPDRNNRIDAQHDPNLAARPR
jgi:carbon storage regulator CsrA